MTTVISDLIERVARYRRDVHGPQRSLYGALARDGQTPKALVISCSDSRVVPELIAQAGPGELFVTRNAGNFVPPHGGDDGVSAAIEYAVAALGVRDIVVCGHSDCGAMKGLLNPGALSGMPRVAAWLEHGHAACAVVRQAYPADLDSAQAVRALAQENVSAQLTHLRTHPCVAAALAAGAMTLHGWFFDIESGAVSALDGPTGRFAPLDSTPAPVAHGPSAPPVADLPALRAAG